MVRVRRYLIIGLLAPLGFVGSCAALLPAAFRLADPLTHRRVAPRDAGRFPILIVHGDEPRVVLLDNLQVIPSLSAGETYFVPEGKEKAFEQHLNDQPSRDPNRWWVLDVRRPAPGRQRIELYLFDDGYDGSVYEATERTVTPLYRKLTGPGFAFIAGACALVMNMAMWGVLAVTVAAVRRRRQFRDLAK